MENQTIEDQKMREKVLRPADSPKQESQLRVFLHSLEKNNHFLNETLTRIRRCLDNAVGGSPEKDSEKKDTGPDTLLNLLDSEWLLNRELAKALSEEATRLEQLL